MSRDPGIGDASPAPDTWLSTTDTLRCRGGACRPLSAGHWPAGRASPTLQCWGAVRQITGAHGYAPVRSSPPSSTDLGRYVGLCKTDGKLVV